MVGYRAEYRLFGGVVLFARGESDAEVSLLSRRALQTLLFSPLISAQEYSSTRSVRTSSYTQ